MATPYCATAWPRSHASYCRNSWMRLECAPELKDALHMLQLEAVGLRQLEQRRVRVHKLRWRSRTDCSRASTKWRLLLLRARERRCEGDLSNHR